MRPFLKGVAVLAALSLLAGCLGGGSGSDSGGSNSNSVTAEPNPSNPGVESVCESGTRVFLDGYPRYFSPSSLSVEVTGEDVGQPAMTVSGIPNDAETLLAFVTPRSFNFLDAFRRFGFGKMHAQAVSGSSLELDVADIINSDSGYFLTLATNQVASQEDKDNFGNHDGYVVYLMAVTQGLEVVKKDLESWCGYVQGPSSNEMFFTTTGISQKITIFTSSSISEGYKDFIREIDSEGNIYFVLNAESNQFELNGSSPLFNTTESASFTNDLGEEYPLDISVPIGDYPDGEFRPYFDISELLGRTVELTYHSPSGLDVVVGSIGINSDLQGFTYSSSEVTEDNDYLTLKPSFSSGFYNLDIHAFYFEVSAEIDLVTGETIAVSLDNMNTEWDFQQRAWRISKQLVMAKGRESNTDFSWINRNYSDVDWSSTRLSSVVLEITPKEGIEVDFEWSASTYDP